MQGRDLAFGSFPKGRFKTTKAVLPNVELKSTHRWPLDSDEQGYQLWHTAESPPRYQVNIFPLKKKRESKIYCEDDSVDKGSCCQPWPPEFSPWDPRGGMREPSSARYPLTYTHTTRINICNNFWKEKNHSSWGQRRVIGFYNLSTASNSNQFGKKKAMHQTDPARARLQICLWELFFWKAKRFLGLQLRKIGKP